MDFPRLITARWSWRFSLDLRGCIEGARDLAVSNASEKGLTIAYAQIKALRNDYLRPYKPSDPVNLLSNAVKFTSYGQVEILFQARTQRACYKIRLWIKDSELEFLKTR
jgi:hypothetical protein